MSQQGDRRETYEELQITHNQDLRAIILTNRILSSSSHTSVVSSAQNLLKAREASAGCMTCAGM